MRKILLLNLSLYFFLLGSYAQTNYYWSGGKKNALTIDSTTIVLRCLTLKDKINFLNNYTISFSNATILSFKDSIGLSIKFSKRLDLKDFDERLHLLNIKNLQKS